MICNALVIGFHEGGTPGKGGGNVVEMWGVCIEDFPSPWGNCGELVKLLENPLDYRGVF